MDQAICFIRSKQIVFSVLILSVAVSSCSKSFMISAPGLTEDQLQFSQAYNKKSGQVFLKDGTIVYSKQIFFETDTFQYQAAGEDTLITTGYNDLEMVRVKDVKRGMRNGFLIGALLGASSGMLTGSLSEVANTDETNAVTEGLKDAAKFGVIWGILGGFFGRSHGGETILYLRQE